MKKGILIILLFSLFAACEKEEPFVYTQETDCIYFEKNNYQMNFADYTEEKGGKEIYRGDSMQVHAPEVKILLLGYRADYPRTIRFKTVPVEGQDSSRLAKVVIDSCVLDSAKAQVKIHPLVFRPQERQVDYKIGLTFDFEGTEFIKGPYEQQIFVITLRDKYTKPSEWDSFFKTYLGEWSPSKHAFVVTFFQKKEIPGYNSPLMWQRKNLPELKKALKEYNDANPDNPKDFTFPD